MPVTGELIRAMNYVDDITTVSYTHLDVYKRQGITRTCQFSASFEGNAVAMKKSITLRAVSYTH